MSNAKDEFVSIALRKNYGEPPTRIKGTLDDVLPLLDFDYDDGYGGQELFGSTGANGYA